MIAQEALLMTLENDLKQLFPDQPNGLYDPARYILSLGGKRFRPMFSLWCCTAFNNDITPAWPIARAVEVFHNFTLVHDDVMDDADIRRGSPTVHKQYDIDTAILSGDVLLIYAYDQLIQHYDASILKSLLSIFNKMAKDVCEGQQYDVDFEQRNDVTIDEYILMITLKTSVLLAAAAQMGALVGGASLQDQKHMYEWAKNFGIAFQLQDDLLDTFGESSLVGKKIGGDILQNKKTYLYLKALDLASLQDKNSLHYMYSSDYSGPEEEKIAKVKHIFMKTNVQEYVQQLIEAYRDLSISHLTQCTIADDHKVFFKHLTQEWVNRKY